MGRSILIIDDDYFMRKLMELMLIQDGHTVLLAGGGTEALEILSKNQIDIITCDIMMPEVDGLEFLRHLKADVNLQKIPIIIITAAGNQQIIQEAVKSGASWVLEKPFTDKEFKNSILNVVAET